MFSRIDINENCAEFVPNRFVPIIPDSGKVLVKRYASYNSCPTPIKKLQKTSIQKASSLSVFKLKLNNTYLLTHSYAIRVVQKFQPVQKLS